MSDDKRQAIDPLAGSDARLERAASALEASECIVNGGRNCLADGRWEALPEAAKRRFRVSAAACVMAWHSNDERRAESTEPKTNRVVIRGPHSGLPVRITEVPDTPDAKILVRVGDVGTVWAVSEDEKLAVIQLANLRMWFGVDQFVFLPEGSV